MWQIVANSAPLSLWTSIFISDLLVDIDKISIIVHNGCTFIYADEYNWRLHIEKAKFYNWSDEIFQKICFQMVRRLSVSSIFVPVWRPFLKTPGNLFTGL